MSSPSFATQPPSRAQRLPEVINQQTSGNKATYTIVTRESDSAFAGHFPDHPVLPGLIQIEWVDYFAKSLVGNSHLQNLELLKFSRLVTPNLQITLEIEKLPSDGSHNKVRFRLFDADGNFSSGRLVYPV